MPLRHLRCSIALLLATVVTSTPAQSTRPIDPIPADPVQSDWNQRALETRDTRLQWFRDARFGCFMHWGVYSALGGIYQGREARGYSEHAMRSLRIPLVDYKKNVVATFNPAQFDADAWVKLIKNAGMRYLIITAKHHDGFAMWPSDAYPYDIRLTPFKRDPMAELSAACQREGIQFGFYYSHAFDWEHPDAPGNDWDYQNPGGDKNLLGGRDWFVAHPELIPKAAKYVDEKAIPQIKELLNKYHPAILWFDTPHKLPYSELVRIMQAVRETDSNVVVNGRAITQNQKQLTDYLDTADRPAEVRDSGGDWECIPTTNESYGYSSIDHSHKPTAHFIRLLASTAAKGGNMLLNVGPRGDGLIDDKDQEILKGIGQWMDVNAESIRGTSRTPLTRQAWGDTTLRGNTLYLHVFNWPANGKLVLGGLKNRVTQANLLSDPTASLKVNRGNDRDVIIDIPKTAPDPADTVIVLTFEGPIDAAPGRLLATSAIANRLLAFDAVATPSLTFGDGKTRSYAVSNFKSPADQLTWAVRANDPADFEVSIKYSAAGDGNYVLSLADESLKVAVKKSDAIQTVSVGRIKASPGTTELKFYPAGPVKDDALRLFEIILTPGQ